MESIAQHKHIRQNWLQLCTNISNEVIVDGLKSLMLILLSPLTYWILILITCFWLGEWGNIFISLQNHKQYYDCEYYTDTLHSKITVHQRSFHFISISEVLLKWNAPHLSFNISKSLFRSIIYCFIRDNFSYLVWEECHVPLQLSLFFFPKSVRNSAKRLQGISAITSKTVTFFWNNLLILFFH